MNNVLVTGASKGLGLGFVQEYLEMGWTVYAVSRGCPPIEHERLHFAMLDLGKHEMIQPVLDKLLGDARPDVVVLNAAMLTPLRDLRETALDDILRPMDVNVWANKAVLDAVLAREPRQVIAISSGASQRGMRGFGAYSLSKAALNMLIMLYAAECTSTHFASLAPGLIDTAMQDELCSTDVDKFPATKALRDKRGTDDMPDGREAARRIVPTFDTLPRRCDSGAYVDARSLQPLRD